MTGLDDLVQAALRASPEQKAEALRILRGEAPVLPSVYASPAAEPFLTLKEAAARLKFDPCTLWRWKVPGHDLGGRRRFKLSEVTAYLNTDAFRRRAASLRASRRVRKNGDDSSPISLATVDSGSARVRRLNHAGTQHPAAS